jgi:hypothetical protein
MKIRLTVLAILSCFFISLPAQDRGDLMVGLNLASAPYRIVEPSVEFFPVTSLSIELSGGYCFNRPTKTMRNVHEQVQGGFANLGARYYFFPQEKLRSFVGIGMYYGNFRRKAEVDLPHYYGNYSESANIKQEKLGWTMILGLHYRHNWLVIQPALKFTTIGSRDDQFPFDYWTPGVGRAGLSNRSGRPRNFGFLPLLQVKIEI